MGATSLENVTSLLNAGRLTADAKRKVTQRNMGRGKDKDPSGELHIGLTAGSYQRASAILCQN
jgi:hypothetical protein